MTEDQARQRVIRSMCPERVCRTCGRPSQRMRRSTDGQQPALAAHIKERRVAAGVTSDEINGWFGFKEIAKNWERTDEWGAAIPSADVWPILKERLGLSDEFDRVIRRHSERHLYDTEGNLVDETPRITGDFMGSGSAGKRDGGITAQWATLGFSDCGHDDWRPGVWLDPFANFDERTE